MKVRTKNLVVPMFMMLTMLCLLAAGCAKKPAATDMDTAGANGTMTEEMGQDMGQAGIGESGLGESGLGEDTGASITDVDALKRIHFEFDQYNLSSDAQRILVDNASYIKANAGLKVRIEGYCDERGSDEYNLALGQRRAMAAKNYLVSLGVPADRLSVISYGEEMPLDSSSTEEAYAMNRRAEFKAEN